MTHTALVNAAVLGFLVVMTLLLVMCITAVIVSPSQVPSSHAAHSHQDGVPSLPLPPAQPAATTPAPLLLRRQPPVTAPAAGFNGWRVPDPETTEPGAPLPLMHDRMPQPEVSGNPPWELLKQDRIPRPEVSGSPPWDRHPSRAAWTARPGAQLRRSHRGRYHTDRQPFTAQQTATCPAGPAV